MLIIYLICICTLLKTTVNRWQNEMGKNGGNNSANQKDSRPHEQKLGKCYWPAGSSDHAICNDSMKWTTEEEEVEKTGDIEQFEQNEQSTTAATKELTFCFIVKVSKEDRKTIDAADRATYYTHTQTHTRWTDTHTGKRVNASKFINTYRRDIRRHWSAHNVQPVAVTTLICMLVYIIIWDCV